MTFISLLLQQEQPVPDLDLLNVIANGGTPVIILAALWIVYKMIWPEWRDWMRSQVSLNKALIESQQNVARLLEQINDDIAVVREDSAVIRDRVGLPMRARRVGDKRDTTP
jgi:hypothetical protein